MENSEVQKDIIKLGKLIVNELKMEPGVDTLGRWMAHYISEKIVAAESVSGDKKEAIDKECFDTILKIWAHRWELPSNRRPFGEFDQIFETLKKLDPDRQTPFYTPWLPDNFRDRGLKKKTKENVWLTTALQIDKSARICIEFALKQAAETTKGKQAENYLEYSAKLAPEHDREIISTLLDRSQILFFDNFDEDEEAPIPRDTAEDKKAQEKKFINEKIKSRIKHLEELSKNARKVLKALRQQLEE
ncbi:hypothetical protein FFJ24_021260 [Pedobacter sp. KBS0701]|uniref:hypothetical protein n=1 Tax=Pedobacter sp. KBS0701 TaxID=2578106 RepID=UPI00110DA10A|nr:hypothetical protein [Pedobacter sp. KBS0701]QDW27217.1 hypothetical protein FFJ24_021260 [Pedobacter sp. KBS0701]